MEQQNDTQQATDYTVNDLANDLLGENTEGINEPETTGDDVNQQVEPTKQGQGENNMSLDVLKELGIEFGDDVDISKLTKEEAITKAKEALAKKSEVDDPFVKEYLEAKKSGLTHDQYLEKKSAASKFVKLNANDGLAAIYKNMTNEDGSRKYSDDVIEQHLGKLTDIEKDQQWSKYKEEFTQQQNKVTDNKTNYASQFDKYNKESVPKLIENISTEIRDSIYGIPFSETDKEAYNKEFQSLLEINGAESEVKQVYPNKAFDLLNDPKTLYELYFIHSKIKNGGLDKLIKDMRDSAVEEALSKAGLSRQRNNQGSEGRNLPPPTPDELV